MVRYVKTPTHVFRFEVTPDTPGRCRRTVRIHIESGPPLDEDDYRRISAKLVAELVGFGCDVYRWSAA
jgi:hypothetical protein